MAFLVDDDYDDQVKDAVLAAILDGSSTIRPSLERKAEAEMLSYLAVRYDATAIFAATGNARNAMIVMLYVDMVLYHAHSRINPGQVPQLRIDRYNEAKSWLEMVASGKLLPDLPLAGDQDGDGVDDKEVVRFGSQTARNPYY